MPDNQITGEYQCIRIPFAPWKVRACVDLALINTPNLSMMKRITYPNPRNPLTMLHFDSLAEKVVYVLGLPEALSAMKVPCSL